MFLTRKQAFKHFGPDYRHRTAGAYPLPALPIVFFGCDFKAAEGDGNLAQCKVCGLIGTQGTVTQCIAAETWKAGGFEYLKTGWYKKAPDRMEYLKVPDAETKQ